MPNTISQKIFFRDTKTKDLYDLYMDSKKNSTATGSPAHISPVEGGRYSAHDNYIKGKNLQLIINRLIVQTWRASDWDKNKVDSTFIICLEQRGNDAVLYATHANVPDNEYDSIKKGWHEYYWKPWKKFLSNKPIKM
ncbi:MAG: SRPBCC domain-containing protein [Bacteroidia bacterium]